MLLACSGNGCLRACVRHAREKGWHCSSPPRAGQRSLTMTDRIRPPPLSLLSAALTFHQSCPAPWCATACAATAQNLYDATQLETALHAALSVSTTTTGTTGTTTEEGDRAAKRARVNSVTPSSSSSSSSSSFSSSLTPLLDLQKRVFYRHERNNIMWMLSHSQRLPCLVLNLARRYDRRVKYFARARLHGPLL